MMYEIKCKACGSDSGGDYPQCPRCGCSLDREAQAVAEPPVVDVVECAVCGEFVHPDEIIGGECDRCAGVRPVFPAEVDRG